MLQNRQNSYNRAVKFLRDEQFFLEKCAELYSD